MSDKPQVIKLYHVSGVMINGAIFCGPETAADIPKETALEWEKYPQWSRRPFIDKPDKKDTEGVKDA